MKKDNIKVSVIMPVMNVEKYIRECIESALSQLLQDIEIICIDDGSTDRSGQMLDEYASTDERITVIHKPNTGYGNSMNIGLDKAKGEYIAILEPDDFIDKNMYRDLYEIAAEYDLDFVKSNFSIVEGTKGNYSITPTNIWWQEEVYNKLLSRSEINELYNAWIAHWSALYKRDFLNAHNIRYNETPGASYQDTGFWFQTMALSKRVMLSTGNYYRYRIDNPGSSMNNPAKVYCISEEYDYIEKRLSEIGILDKILPQYTLMRYISHRDTARRIADRFKEEFVTKTSEKLNDLKMHDMIDMSAMNEIDKCKLCLWMNDPRQFLKDLTLAQREIDKRLEEFKSFYIYGAGVRGKRIYMNLSDEAKEKLAGFIVTEKRTDFQKVYSKPVYEISELSIDADAVILIGVTNKYSDEIKNILSEKRVRNIATIPEDVI